jgi:hypothetical protein
VIDVEILRTALVEAEESKLCGDCLSDTCEVHDELPDNSLGCADAELIAEWYKTVAAYRKAEGNG